MAKNQKRWYTPEFKMEVIQNYLGGNYKTEQYCNEIGIAKATFYKWLKTYNQATSTEAVLPTPSFQDITPIVKPNVEPVKTSKIKITLPNKIIIEFESSELKNVMAELK